jgi:hypothetical protein
MSNSRWSVGSGKLESIPSLNTNTLSNDFCNKMKSTETICKMCYSHSMLGTFRKNCVPKFELNSKMLSEDTLSQDDILYRGFGILSKAARFHSHGELINRVHMINILRICRNFPNTTFSLWTKRKNLVYSGLKLLGKPSNLILIYSNPKINSVMDKVPDQFDKVFNNVTEKSEQVNCHQKCKDCMMCYTIGNKTTQIVEVV